MRYRRTSRAGPGRPAGLYQAVQQVYPDDQQASDGEGDERAGAGVDAGLRVVDFVAGTGFQGVFLREAVRCEVVGVGVDGRLVCRGADLLTGEQNIRFEASSLVRSSRLSPRDSGHVLDIDNLRSRRATVYAAAGVCYRWLGPARRGRDQGEE